jgi:chorismate dehydratase
VVNGVVAGDPVAAPPDPVAIGSVPYLNARPLMRWFLDTEEGRASGVRVVEAVPSALAEMLERAEVAAALVSSFELFRRPGLCAAPDIAVAADGPVLSVRMLSKVPVRDIGSVALDTSSLTSVALLKILLAEQFGLAPRYLPAAPDLARMLETADAALLIGDLGYRDDGTTGLHVIDLGEAWRRLTGLPFVYALWIGHPEGLTPSLVSRLARAKEWGTAHLEEIARREYRARDETLGRTRSYLTEIMRYELGPRERKALARFGAKAFEHGLLPAPPGPALFAEPAAPDQEGAIAAAAVARSDEPEEPSGRPHHRSPPPLERDGRQRKRALRRARRFGDGRLAGARRSRLRRRISRAVPPTPGVAVSAGDGFRPQRGTRRRERRRGAGAPRPGRPAARPAPGHDLPGVERRPDGRGGRDGRLQGRPGELVDRVRAGTRADVLLVTPNTRGDAGDDGGLMDDYVRAMRAVAREREVGLADVYAVYQGAIRMGADPPDLLANRVSHPTREGHRIFANALIEFFQP